MQAPLPRRRSTRALRPAKGPHRRALSPLPRSAHLISAIRPPTSEEPDVPGELGSADQFEPALGLFGRFLGPRAEVAGFDKIRPRVLRTPVAPVQIPARFGV